MAIKHDYDKMENFRYHPSLKSKNAATQMNYSRQPHTIFSITVYTKENTDGG